MFADHVRAYRGLTVPPENLDTKNVGQWWSTNRHIAQESAIEDMDEGLHAEDLHGTILEGHIPAKYVQDNGTAELPTGTPVHVSRVHRVQNTWDGEDYTGYSEEEVPHKPYTSKA
jgi:hypothetical protein